MTEAAHEDRFNKVILQYFVAMSENFQLCTRVPGDFNYVKLLQRQRIIQRRKPICPFFSNDSINVLKFVSQHLSHLTISYE